MSTGNNQGQVPILVLKEGTTETKDRDAKRNNITAAKVVAELVRTSLGPRGYGQNAGQNARELNMGYYNYQRRRNNFQRD
jgi:hypothetical protein